MENLHGMENKMFYNIKYSIGQKWENIFEIRQ